MASLQQNDRFSLALARLAAQRIMEVPERIMVALATLNRWKERRGDLTPASAEWEALIQSRSPQEIAALLVDETEEGQRRRSSHPFIQAPFFTEEERINLIAATHGV